MDGYSTRVDFYSAQFKTLNYMLQVKIVKSSLKLLLILISRDALLT